MPQHKSAIKRLRQNKKRNKHNKARRSKLRSLIKDVLSTTDKKTAEKKLKDAVSFIDRASQKNLIHKKTAARKKSQLTRHVNNL